MLIEVMEAKEKHIEKIVIAGDSLTTLQAMNDPEKISNWIVQPIINDIRNSSHTFQSWQTRKICQDLNHTHILLRNGQPRMVTMESYTHLNSPLSFKFSVVKTHLLWCNFNCYGWL